jgi:hypothetical protein
MATNIKLLIIGLVIAALGWLSCKKTTYSVGILKTPSNLTLTAVVAGVDSADTAGNGSGQVLITAKADNAITYSIDFGDGTPVQIVAAGTINYKYNNPGTFTYTIIVNAIGTGGIISTITKNVTVFDAFVIPPFILQDLTNDSSKVWVTDRNTSGHVGVGPISDFTPDYYSALPNQRADCLYDDEITFSKSNNNITMSVDNKGETFIIAAATSFYGVSGGDSCYTVNAGGVKPLVFMDATSASTPDISTRVQFVVPGNGIVNFATGGNTYEILTITDSTVQLRNIGIDGNAWYQKLKIKQ